MRIYITFCAFLAIKFIREREKYISKIMSREESNKHFLRKSYSFRSIYGSIFELSYSTINRLLLKIIAFSKAKTKEILC
jgi:hypothetical protein